MNPVVGHLYHDGNISSIYTTLDVQDKLRTREINARETKHLDKHLHVLDRAKTVCKRRREWEQRHVREELSDIKSKTPTLASGLMQESERIRNKRRLPSSANVALPRMRVRENDPRAQSEKDLVLVSLWSVYSNGRRTRNHSAAESGRTTQSLEEKYQRTRGDKSGNKRTKTANFSKRSEHVAKTLHRLFSQTRERKLQESHTSVLDILRRESREELETALFVLRGTPTGNAIEDILHERQMVVTMKRENEKTNKHSEKSIQAPGDQDVFVSQLNKPSGAGSSVNGSSQDTEILTDDSGVPIANTNNGNKKKLLSRRFTKSAKSETSNETGSTASEKYTVKRWLETHNETNIEDVFGDDASQSASSNIANASDSGSVRSPGMKWTELFKAPELWKQTQKYAKHVRIDPQRISLVTLTGKRRQTMLKR